MSDRRPERRHFRRIPLLFDVILEERQTLGVGLILDTSLKGMYVGLLSGRFSLKEPVRRHVYLPDSVICSAILHLAGRVVKEDNRA